MPFNLNVLVRVAEVVATVLIIHIGYKDFYYFNPLLKSAGGDCLSLL